jgi:tetratricopeptide (TPR) repeat protein
MRKNDFNGSYMPLTALKDFESNNTVQPIVQNLSFVCPNSIDAGSIWEIRDLGNGIIDTIYYIADNTGYQPTQDESLYNTAMLKKESGEYFDAISIFKMLINDYPDSSYTDASLFSLYECYEGLDTSSNQGIRYALYGDLKTYLEVKIQSGLYSDEFNSDAYQIIAMCETQMGDYEEAMEGYEFIALYHPDPYIRLLASWDYSELEEILFGGGGISSKEENLSAEEYQAKLESKVNQMIKEDPIKKKVKKSFDKTTTKNNERKEKEILSKTSDKNVAEQELAKLKKADEKIINKVISVLRYSKSLTKDVREKKQIEDIVFTLSEKEQKLDNLKINTIPDEYSLSQNYPNPFNPITKINYELPKDGLVKLVIYDILGREIKTLVNELKQAGRYTVEFNGNGFASGVYFYRIQSGNFVQVKRMVLIK